MAGLDWTGADLFFSGAEGLKTPPHPEVNTDAMLLKEWRISQRTRFDLRPPENAADIMVRRAIAREDVNATPLHPDFDVEAVLTPLHGQLQAFK